VVYVCEQLVGTVPLPHIGSDPSPVTVWEPPALVQITVSPTFIVRLLGRKVNAVPPKATKFVAARTIPAVENAAIVATNKLILSEEQSFIVNLLR